MNSRTRCFALIAIIALLILVDCNPTLAPDGQSPTPTDVLSVTATNRLDTLMPPQLSPTVTLGESTPTPSPTIEIVSPTAMVVFHTPPPLPQASPRPTSLPTSLPLASSVSTPLPTMIPPSTACPYGWFTSVPTIACPDEPAIVGEVAAQPFEHGWMIWLKAKGQYLIMVQGSGLEQVFDPLTVSADTSTNYAPPAGLFAPVSGFGLIWRGDVTQASAGDYPPRLGWATSPEFGYNATYQCAHGVTPHWSCYLSGPRGGLIGYGTPGLTWFYTP